MDILNVGSDSEHVAAANAEDWYRYVNDNQRCAREVKNGDLRLVMGCYRPKYGVWPRYGNVYTFFVGDIIPVDF